MARLVDMRTSTKPGHLLNSSHTSSSEVSWGMPCPCTGISNRCYCRSRLVLTSRQTFGGHQ